MKRFIRNSVIFGCLTFVLAIGLDYVISYGLQHRNEYLYSPYHEIRTGKAQADIVVMGNSRGFAHFSPSVIDSITGMSVFCLGQYPINVQIAKYHYFRAYNPAPKLIVAQVDFVNTFRIMNLPHQHQSEQFLPFMWDGKMRALLRELGYSWVECYVPFYRYWGYQKVIKDGILEFVGMKYSNDTRCAYRGHYPERHPWDGKELERLTTFPACWDEDACDLWESFLNECESEGIMVLLVNSPMYAPAVALVDKENEMNQYFDSVAKSHNTFYWNYTKDYDMNNDSANFCVSVHLNEQATQIFSADFAERLLVDSIIQ